MAVEIPDKFIDLFNKRAFGHLATLMPDGSPQVTPVWCDFDGTHVLINSARGRQKDKNMKRNARVALSILDPDNPYRYLAARGKVTEITEQGSDAHVDKTAKKYLERAKYLYRRPDEVRVIYKVLPIKTTQMG